MWETITQQLSPDVVEFCRLWLKPSLFAAGAALGIQAGLEWILSPLFVLPGLRRFDPLYRASRPLLAFGLQFELFLRLHYHDVVQFGPGEAGWEKVGLFALVGTAGAQVLHALFKKRGISNEAALEVMRGTVDAAVAKLKGGNGAGAPPAPPAGGGS